MTRMALSTFFVLLNSVQSTLLNKQHSTQCSLFTVLYNVQRTAQSTLYSEQHNVLCTT